VIENAGLKKSLRKTKVFLDNTYGYDTLALVESHATPRHAAAAAAAEAFCFLGLLSALSRKTLHDSICTG
jgi:hypothetical protein